MAGILANDEEAERALISEAIKIGKRLGVDQIELRQPTPLSCFTGKPPMSSVNSINPTNPINPSNPINSSNPINPSNSSNPTNPMNPINISMKSKKTRMLLSLPDSPETLLKSFKSKLRSQIKRPIKEGLCAKAGGIELLEDFYKVFLINMRELGSPVHSKKIMKYVLEVFVEQSKIIIVYNKSEPLACSLICAYKNTLQNPWSSALRQHSTVSANMFLYWKML
ncbi:MAG TPA: hypothetical protein VMW09_10480, partial [Desulfatiglandales bacterium]|nr:hypothetical protein [Desulfatiglandales bacterium]